MISLVSLLDLSLARLLRQLRYRVSDAYVRFLVRMYIWTRSNSLMLALKYGRQDYEIVEYDDFLTPEECDLLVSKAESVPMHDSIISNDDGDRLVDTSVRKSKTCWMKDGDDAIAKRISQKVQKIVPLPLENQEDLQVVRYGPDEYYHPHYDTPYRPSAIPYFNKYHGPRVATCIIYLNDDFVGGETEFFLVDKVVKPKKGKAVLFFNIDSDLVLIPESIHMGRVVTRGTKWIANKWVRVWPMNLRPDTLHLHSNGWMFRTE